MDNNERDLAKACTRAVNSYVFNCEKFCDAMLGEHRTLQQSFTRLCIAWLRRLAVLEPYQIDPRNEYSVRIGKIVTKALDDAEIGRVPMV